MLHITNGDAVSDRFPAMRLPGEMIAWRDVLHEGPVPAGLTLDALRPVRAVFLADMGWAEYSEVYATFTARDATLAHASDHEEVVLWFEHDLYDQLQLLQILDALAGQEIAATRLSLICITSFPGIVPFLGLGQIPTPALAALFPMRQAISSAALALARAAWAAFRAPDPIAIETLLLGDTRALPFLAAALRRHLEQFPAVNGGLARTERQILEVIAAGATTPPEILRAERERDSCLFQGDAGLWTSIHALSATPTPLVIRQSGGAFALPGECENQQTFHAQRLTLTELGRQLLARQADWVRLRGINRWLGGVHLAGCEARWRWDEAASRLVRRESAGQAAG
ncbi:MAG: hypothetical protein IVW57_10100 [Ktedonobacterales bacterium]|nr:hypothetical protein [Ktedonobacterales bacterium]